MAALFKIEMKPREPIHSYMLEMLLDGISQTFIIEHSDQAPTAIHKFFFKQTVRAIDKLYHTDCSRSQMDEAAFHIQNGAPLRTRGLIQQHVLDTIANGLTETLGDISTKYHKYLFADVIRSIDRIFLDLDLIAQTQTLISSYGSPASTSSLSSKRNIQEQGSSCVKKTKTEM